MLEMAKIRRALVLVGTWIIKSLLRAGVPMGPMILLTVRGRTTGQPRTTPVDLLERNGRRWLVATHGGASSNWVRNLPQGGRHPYSRPSPASGYRRGAVPRGSRDRTQGSVGASPGVARARIGPSTHPGCGTRRLPGRLHRGGPSPSGL